MPRRRKRPKRINARTGLPVAFLLSCHGRSITMALSKTRDLFMRQISGLWIIAALSAGLVAHCASRLHAADQRTFEPAVYVLQIGDETGSVHSLEGGSPVAQVGEEKAIGADQWPHKHVTAWKVEDV